MFAFKRFVIAPHERGLMFRDERFVEALAPARSAVYWKVPYALRVERVDIRSELRLKELETLEKVTEKVDRLTVFGGLDGVLKDTIKINV